MPTQIVVGRQTATAHSNAAADYSRTDGAHRTVPSSFKRVTCKMCKITYYNTHRSHGHIHLCDFYQHSNAMEVREANFPLSAFLWKIHVVNCSPWVYFPPAQQSRH